MNVCSSGPVLNKPQATMLCYAKKKIDIICLAEIKISKVNQNFYYHKDYNTYLNLPSEHLQNSPKEGVATLIRKDLNVNDNDVRFLVKGRATHIKVKLNEEDFECICLYAPSQSDTVSAKFFETLFNTLQDSDECENRILIGDFNTTLDPKLDRKDSAIKYQKIQTSKLINDYALDNSLVDPWRTTHPGRQ